MFFSDVSGFTFFLLMLPAILNLWTIWHAMKHDFPNEKERVLWVLAGIFLPVLGGISYLVFGMKRSKPINT
ncbi:MAG: PLD nuclease N-terminal domain-containing protein [Mailhella sp.]|nr:PLD nuclease N-terminal domain-containing protein [Mailhella sp.]